MVFIIDDEYRCQDKINNITNASGCIILYNTTRGQQYADTSNCNFSVVKVGNNEENLTDILNMLSNQEVMFVDNVLDNKTLTFTYNLSQQNCLPLGDYFFLHKIKDPVEIEDHYFDLGFAKLRAIACYHLNYYSPDLGHCWGIILYDSFDTHFMSYSVRDWRWFSKYYKNGPALPFFSVNYSVGNWMNENISLFARPRVSGYLDQEYKQQTPYAPDVKSNNVVGYRNIINSPDNKIVVISNRIDGWWGQTPGDSGVGGAIVLGIAKYMNDFNIKPKYNLTFLFTTGEEYGMRGAQHFVDSHTDENYILWIGTDQLAFDQNNTNLTLIYSNKAMSDILSTITEETDYPNRINLSYGLDLQYLKKGKGGGTELKVWRDKCDSICFGKDNTSIWRGYHRTGANYSKGDTIYRTDRDDVNVTLELVWNLTKYYTVNPDSWIDSYSATAFDSPNDNDTKDDSVNITFSLKTILPNDKIRVKAELKKTFSINEIIDNCTIDYVINTTGINDSIILSIPENAGAGLYTCRFYLYNSTGRTNDIVDIGLPCQRYNDSKSDWFYLYRINENMVTPYFSNVGCSSQNIGCGSSNTISGCVSSTVNSTINQVQFYVLYPDNTIESYDMTKSGGDNVYEILFNNTWQNGEHQYCIWAIDENGNSSISDWYSFNTSIQTNISIATLKDNYGRDEFIDITDPPISPENYMLVDQGFTWNKYYDAVSGNNILEIFTEPVNYQDDNGTWTSINCSLQELAINHPAYSYGYRFGNEHGLYNVYFKPNIQSNWPVAFAYNKSNDLNIHVVRSKLVGVGYLDPQSNWAYEYLQNVQNSQGQFTNNKATYENVFTGTDVTWSYDNIELKEKITLSNTTKSLLQNHPPSLYGLQNNSSYLVFITKLDYQNLILYNASSTLNGNVTISDGWIAFKDILGYFKCAMPIGDAYELYNESVRYKLVYRVLQYNGNYYLLSGLKVQDLNNMSFPVVIDPTITISGNENDGFIYKSSSNYNTAWSTGEGIISIKDSYISIGQSKVASFPPDYRIRRGFLFFNTSELPSNAYIESTVLSLYKKDDYSDTDFTITVQNGQPDYPHDPLEERDYNKDFYSGNGGELNTLNFVNGRNNITLTNLSWINVGGVTKLCLRSDRDIGGTAPTGSEYVNVYSTNVEGELNPDPRPKLVIVYRNQSKIKNTGLTNITGYLLMQVQYLEDKEWVVDHNTIDETSPRTIPVGDQLALDMVFNGLVNTNDLCHGCGTYRVYACFCDPEGNVLVCDDDSLLEASYEFTLTFE